MGEKSRGASTAPGNRTPIGDGQAGAMRYMFLLLTELVFLTLIL